MLWYHVIHHWNTESRTTNHIYWWLVNRYTTYRVTTQLIMLFAVHSRVLIGRFSSKQLRWLQVSTVRWRHRRMHNANWSSLYTWRGTLQNIDRWRRVTQLYSGTDRHWHVEVRIHYTLIYCRCSLLNYALSIIAQRSSPPALTHRALILSTARAAPPTASERLGRGEATKLSDRISRAKRSLTRHVN